MNASPQGILVVDDDDQFRNLLTEVLKRAGFQVAAASDGQEAMKLFQQRPAQLIVTDLIMPNKEGLETIIELRRSHPQVRIIAMSGGGRVGPQDYLALAKMLGADRVFAKPFRSAEFLQAVRELVDGAAPSAVPSVPQG
jgi:DNA-binding response OmpR family regulator